ncbi:hypothetical protein AVEN_146490-1 [Araneus ventricosus]|uniref:Uncharacterized protein n=1 Tax=Araneus ventricosus TaxID=182803 RepID=A0A4Y2VA12_ARAVE|nr:hypothetical protein AVEN_146490-1 [Araneus ventricosus]
MERLCREPHSISQDGSFLPTLKAVKNARVEASENELVVESCSEPHTSLGRSFPPWRQAVKECRELEASEMNLSWRLSQRNSTVSRTGFLHGASCKEMR